MPIPDSPQDIAAALEAMANSWRAGDDPKRLLRGLLWEVQQWCREHEVELELRVKEGL